jgi:thiol-disulfide isomerase/thioredoxin
MANRKLWIAGAALAALVAAALLLRGGGGPAPKEEEVGRAAAEFAYPDLQGKPLKLSSLRGKAVLVDFWATWCGPCVEDIPGLESLQAKYKDRGFTVLGISIDEAGPKEVAAFVKEKKVNYPVVVTGGQDKLPEGYAVFGLPTAYLIDAAGVVREKYYGPKDEAAVGKDIETVLHAKS